jgi:hypothetical protein
MLLTRREDALQLLARLLVQCNSGHLQPHRQDIAWSSIRLSTHVLYIRICTEQRVMRIYYQPQTQGLLLNYGT